MEKGASSWLSSLPLEQYGFPLHKDEFIDVICLQYGFTLSLLPSHCVCGKDFTMINTFSCPHGPIIRHNEVCHLTACLMTEICHDVQVEPHSHPFSSEVMRYRSAVTDNNASVDIRVSSFWRYLHHSAYIDAQLVFSIFLQPPIDLPPWLILSVDMRLRSVVLMRNEFVKLSMAALPL